MSLCHYLTYLYVCYHNFPMNAFMLYWYTILWLPLDHGIISKTVVYKIHQYILYILYYTILYYIYYTILYNIGHTHI